jgi:endonuclease/exonuclease/phosphatase (EEP) superfamily protein YafD
VIAAVVLLFPILGVRLSPLSLGAGRGDLRLITCNVHHQHLDVDAMRACLDSAGADVVTLQGWSESGHESLFGAGWDLRRDGEVLVASRLPIVGVTSLPLSEGPGTPQEERGTAVRIDLRAPAGVISLISLHLASPHAGLTTVSGDEGSRLTSNSERRWRESAALSDFASRLGNPVILAGDFNTTDDSPIFRENWGSFADAFSECGWGLGYTYLNMHTQIRIDHVLTGPGVRAVAFRVGPDVGSPHRPLIADLNFR